LQLGDVMFTRSSNLLRLAVSIGVSLLLLAFILRLALGQDDAARPGVLSVLRNVSVGYVGGYVVFSLVQTFFRAVRYRVLIRAASEAPPPTLLHTTLVTLARNMFVDLLPARAGELSYIAMMNRGYSVPGGACVSSLSVSFLFDLIALLLILLVLAARQLLTAGIEGWLLGVLGVLLLVCVAGVLVLFLALRPAVALARRLAGKLARWKPVDKTLVFADEAAEAIAFTRRSGTLGAVLGLSLLVRGGKYAGLIMLFHAVAGPSFPVLADAPVFNVLCALLGAEAAASLPIPAFMSFGAYEAGGLLALTLLGFAAASSGVVMLAMHILSQCVDYLLGGAGLVAFIFSAARPRVAAASRPGRRLVFAAAAAALVVAGLGSAAWQWRKVGKLGSLRPPGAGAPVRPTEAQHRRRAAATRPLRGFLVWSSNRYGNHDILMMRLPGLAVTRLTTHAHTETFPRISPDGRRVVFCRSRAPWVSQRNPLAWDVVIIELATGKETRLAENANTPTWSDDGQAVLYQHRSGRFVRHALAPNRAGVLLESGSGPVPENVELQTPHRSDAAAASVVTLRGARRAVMVYPDRGDPVTVSRSGCQGTWSPDGRWLYFVDHGGRGKNAIFRRAFPSGKNELWLDLEGAYSHEYFPRPSNDGRHLVLGACAAGHEHDTADYEIFLWAAGAAPADAVRLTFHSGNDCWPDLWLEQGRAVPPRNPAPAAAPTGDPR
jgi:hypothetical protein